MSQESNKEPVVQFVGRILFAAVYMKKVRKITDASKLAPMTLLTFFSLLRKPGWLRYPDCRFGGQCPLPVPIKLCAGTGRPTWTN